MVRKEFAKRPKWPKFRLQSRAPWRLLDVRRFPLPQCVSQLQLAVVPWQSHRLSIVRPLDAHAARDRCSDAGQAECSPPKPTKPWETPAFQAWVEATQALPAEQQIEAVSKKLMELNPGFDGTLAKRDGMGKPIVEKGVVTVLSLCTDNVTDISPVRALTGLKVLYCEGSGTGKGRLSDLSPLGGMTLAELHCHYTQVSDLRRYGE